MPITIDVQQALALLGAKTLELEQLRGQCETIASEFNNLQKENLELKQRVEELENRYERK